MSREKETVPLQTKEFTEALQHDLVELIKRAYEISEGHWDGLMNDKDNAFAEAHPHIYYAAHIIRELEKRNVNLDSNEIFKLQVDLLNTPSKEYSKYIEEDLNNTKRFYEAFLRYYYNYCWIPYGKTKLNQLGINFQWVLFSDYILDHEKLSPYKLIIQRNKVVSPYLLQDEQEYRRNYEDRINIEDIRLLNDLESIGITNAKAKKRTELLGEVDELMKKVQQDIRKNTELVSSLVKAENDRDAAEEKVWETERKVEKSRTQLNKISIDLPKMTFWERVAAKEKGIFKLLNYFMSKDYKKAAKDKLQKIEIHQQAIQELNSAIKDFESAKIALQPATGKYSEVYKTVDENKETDKKLQIKFTILETINQKLTNVKPILFPLHDLGAQKKLTLVENDLKAKNIIPFPSCSN